MSAAAAAATMCTFSFCLTVYFSADHARKSSEEETLWIVFAPVVRCTSGCVVQCRICNQIVVADSNLGQTILHTKVYSAFHPSGVGN